MSAPMQATAEALAFQSTEPPQIESKPVLVVVAQPDVSLLEAEAAMSAQFDDAFARYSRGQVVATVTELQRLQ